MVYHICGTSTHVTRLHMQPRQGILCDTQDGIHHLLSHNLHARACSVVTLAKRHALHVDTNKNADMLLRQLDLVGSKETNRSNIDTSRAMRKTGKHFGRFLYCSIGQVSISMEAERLQPNTNSHSKRRARTVIPPAAHQSCSPQLS